MPSHTYIISYQKRGHPRAQQPRLLASTCSIKHIIKRIHVRTNETTSSNNVHPRAYIYTSHKIHVQSYTCSEYPSTQLYKKYVCTSLKTHKIQAAATKNQGGPPALPSGNHIPDHSPCQPPLTPPPAPPPTSPPLTWASVPVLVPSLPREPPETQSL